jgi:UDP-2,3-diacylglucosamine pyrophosphatase LpxH
MTRTYVISDLHLGDGSADDLFFPYADRLDRFLAQIGRNERLVIAGDLLELWQFDLGAVVKKYRWLLTRLADMGAMLLTGNHDAELLGVHWLEGFRIVSENDVTEQGIRIVHGHQYDWANSGGSWLGKWVTQRFTNHPKLDRWLSDRTCWFRERGLEEAAVAGGGVMIAGHTHRAKQIIGFGGPQQHYINVGCWIGPEAHYAVIEDGRARLERFE